MAEGSDCQSWSWSRGPHSITTRSTFVCFANRAAVVAPCEAPLMITLSQSTSPPSLVQKTQGALIGPLLFARVLSHRDWLMPGLALSMATYGLAYLGVSISPWFWLALGLVVIAHVSGGGNWVMSNYALQIEVPDHLRGRVFATDMMIVTLAISASVLVAGALAVPHYDNPYPKIDAIWARHVEAIREHESIEDVERRIESLEHELIPSLREQQAELERLEAVELERVPERASAAVDAMQRYFELEIRAYERELEALRSNDAAAFTEANALHEQAFESLDGLFQEQQ